MKVGNIGRLDPDLKERGITGLVHGAKMEEQIWEEFYGNPELLAYESEKIIAQLSNTSIENSTAIKVDDLPQGLERTVLIKQRVNQSFFRSAVMSAYNFRCCISGVNAPQLVDACHIVDWAEDFNNRTNPKNGLCMNPFFHKAYDKFLLAITPDMSIKISDELHQNATERSFANYLKEIDGKTILTPDKFIPQRELLEIHYNAYKCRN